mmetsp:Transcript_38735/g.152955  ORF Transcript_38735/g.152955 Transcript_38735/m.152955 type:complete len:134 (-) Transcript_38735:1932-2333(-)
MSYPELVRYLVRLKIFISQLLKRCTVFARMSAADKTLLVRLMNNEVGSLVGMCGDGANDAGALREAAVGISLCGDEDGEVTASLAAPLTSRITTISAVASSMKEVLSSPQCGRFHGCLVHVSETTLVSVAALQ